MSDPFHPDVLAEQAAVLDAERRRKSQRMRVAMRMTEDELLEQTRTLCQALGLLHYHTHDSRGSQPGYPDWHIIGPQGSIFRELKTERGRLSADQQEWLDSLRNTGHDVDVWRPRDLINGRIQRELSRLSKIKVQRNTYA